MTSELRPAKEVVRGIYGNPVNIGASIIKADREAVRAEVVGEIVAWLRHDEDPYPDSYDIADEIEAKFGEKT